MKSPAKAGYERFVKPNTTSYKLGALGESAKAD